MQRKKFECASCDAYGTISYDLDSEFYDVTVCPFCGADISEDSESDEDE